MGGWRGGGGCIDVYSMIAQRIYWPYGDTRCTTKNIPVITVFSLEPSPGLFDHSAGGVGWGGGVGF